MRTETVEWIEKAERDLLTAQREFRADEPNFDAVCFHAQQCAEKYLKALLQEHVIRFPKTHDLELLLELLKPVADSLAQLASPAQSLADYSVEFRYPGVWADREIARAALENCRSIRAEMRRTLAMPEERSESEGSAR